MALATLKLYKITRRFRLGNVSAMCTYPKEIALNNSISREIITPITNKAPDLLLQKLTATHSLDETMKIVDNHSQIFNKIHILRVLRTIFDLSKTDSKLHSNVLCHRSFEQLLFSIKKHCRTMELNEVIEVIKILAYLKVPSNSDIFQTLLQLVRQSINRLDLQPAMFLHFILSKCETTHLSESLKLALPLVFQLQLDLQIDHENIPQLVELLMYSSKYDIPEKYVNKIMTCILLQIENLDTQHLPSLIRSMCSLKNLENKNLFEKLFHLLLNSFAENINEYPYEKIISTLNFLKEIVIENDKFYNEKLFDSFANYAVTNDIGFKHAIQISKILTRIGHFNSEILEYLSDKVISNPKQVFSSFFFTTYLNCLCSANYKPSTWEVVLQYLTNNSIFLCEKSKYSWIKYAVQLASLDYYDLPLFEKLLSDQFIEEDVVINSHKLNFLQYLYLHAAVKAFYPLSNVSVPTYILNRGVEISCEIPIHPMLKQSLEQALGGEQYFASNVLMPNGLFVDSVIGYRDGNYPVAILNCQNQKIVKYEELDLKNCKHIICILGYHKGHFSRNGYRLKGHSDLVAKILKQSGHNPLIISLPTWLNLPNAEKIPFLMREINFKLTEITNINHND